MLHRGRAYEPIIRWAKHHFRCSTFEANVRPVLRTPAKHPASYSINQLLGVDLFFVRSPVDGKELTLTNPGIYMVGIVSCVNWLRLAGTPRIFISDGGGKFQGYFSTCLGQAGVAYYMTGSRSPLQNGRTERGGAECKRVRNRHNMASGFSANHGDFGIERGSPDSLICPAQRLALMHEGPLEQVRNADAVRVTVRQAATRAWATLDNRDLPLQASRAKHRTPTA
eukprot:6465419-Amphidinium_carterae.3